MLLDARCRPAVQAGRRNAPTSRLVPLTRPVGRVPARGAAAAAGKGPAPQVEQAPAVAPQLVQAAPEAVADAQQIYPGYGQQPGVVPQYYTAAPPMPPMYPPGAYAPPPPAAAAAATAGVPWWVWLGVGFAVAKLADFVSNLTKKGPQAMMAEMAMKQMMKGMNMPPGGMPGGMGGMPGGAPGASPFGAAGAPNFGPYGAANPFAPNFKPPVDTTATAVENGAGPRGEKFAARAAAPAAEPKAAEKKEEAKPAAAAAAAAAAGATAAAATNGMPVVEAAEVKEPAGASSSDAAAGASSSGSGASSSGGAASFFTDVGGGAGAGGEGGTADVGQMTAMMEQMLRDPNMQKMLYPYLPEPMRNPQSIEWMLNTPEVRKQLEQTLANSGMSMSPQMMQMMQQMDFSQDKVQQQFSELGLKPEDVISKVLENPELASGFSNPKVQAAIFDISQNPMNVMKYQEDPEIMKVLEKVTELFSPQKQ
ncbi:hypothetical protein Rsub_12482 [Raphidocelis subcapitata]|uniref:Protein TIC 40, chloroplastic n=1 Tax=Raphidocelis subcapitata TaxID=307507 RepID=A0A2V0PNJ0_9CHLO|nr:hypothetical protein Rsub_12482 [Raphidocelis subcapitata]|eukprot:GBF99663.1 hypothetical protein Rsub_12482 [Raphidocelis subcapitata]